MKIKKLRRLNEDLDTNTLVNDILKCIDNIGDIEDIIEYFPYLLSKYLEYSNQDAEEFLLSGSIDEYIIDWGFREAYNPDKPKPDSTLSDNVKGYTYTNMFIPDFVRVSPKLKDANISSIIWRILADKYGWYYNPNIDALFLDEDAYQELIDNY